MSVLGGRQVIGGNEVDYRVEKSRYTLDMESFSLGDKCRIIAINDTFAWLNPYQNRFMLVNQDDGEGMAS